MRLGLFLVIHVLTIASATADTLYTGGDILTMRGPAPEYVESLVERDGQILFAGPLAQARTLVNANATTIDLGGKTLLPGFIDTHGHFVYFGKNLVDANLFGCADIADLVTRMKKQVEQTPADGWIVGFGYQARGLKEGRAPTSEELDQVSADRPVMIVDSSGHLGAANAAAFKAAGISADTPDPTGGMFTRKADGKSLAGRTKRKRCQDSFSNHVPEKSPDTFLLGRRDCLENARSGNRLDLHLRRERPMAGAAAVVLPAGELLHEDFVSLHEPDDLGLDGGALHGRRAERELPGLADGEHIIEHHLAAGGQMAEVDLHLLPLHDAILAAAVGDNRVKMVRARHAGGGVSRCCCLGHDSGSDAKRGSMRALKGINRPPTSRVGPKIRGI